MREGEAAERVIVRFVRSASEMRGRTNAYPAKQVDDGRAIFRIRGNLTDNLSENGKK